MPPTSITFFQRLLPLILSGQKTITIRDESESHYQAGSVVQVFPYDGGEGATAVCRIQINSVEGIAWEDIGEIHAQQEGMGLEELKTLLREIYPHANRLFVISYQLLPTSHET